jgi:GT2 family glycosyltransferase
MKEWPKVAIIVLNYNNWSDTIECLESVLRNDYDNYQVIVVDNNSPNNSMDYIKAWAEGKIDVWVNPKNPLRRFSFPPGPKPIPYVYYTREEAEKGGNKDLEKALSERISTDITTKYPLIFIQSGENLGYTGGNNVGIRNA